MYQLGDRFMYGAHGVCEILDIEQKRIDKKDIEYYVLAPIGNAKACFYIPTNNPKALSKLSPLLTMSELKELLLEQAKGRDVWVNDENARKQRLKEVIASGDHAELIQWVRTLHIHRKKLVECGKKFHQIDENFLKDAEKILITEFSVILEIPEASVVQYIQNLIVA